MACRIYGNRLGYQAYCHREYGDGVFLQVFANLYKKDIIIVPVDVEDAVNKEVG